MTIHFCRKDSAVLEGSLQHGRVVSCLREACRPGKLEVKGKGAGGLALHHMGQVAVLLIGEQVAVSFGGSIFWGGTDSQQAAQGLGGRDSPVDILQTRPQIQRLYYSGATN